eukprot:gene8210-9772_t
MLEMIVNTSEVLEKIDVGKCELITDAGVIAVAHRCPQLRFFVLNWLPISDDALDHLTKLCPNISCLDITANSVVTDQGVHTIAKNLSQLHHISIASCENLTDASVEHLTKYNAPTLQELRAYGLPSLRVDVLLALLQKCPHLHTLSLDCDLEAYHADIIPYMCNLQTLFVDSGLSDGPLSPAPEANELNDAGIDSRVIHGWNELAKFEDRKYTEKGLLALMDGLPLLQKLGVHEKEIQEGLLTPFVQKAWRRLRPNIVFSNDLDDFITNITIT